MVVDDEYLEPVLGIRERLLDEPVVLPAHLPVVEVRLRGVDARQDHVLEVYDRLTLPEEPLEVDVADVARVVVAGDDHDVLALDTIDVLRGLFELFPVPRVGEVPEDHHRRRIHAVDLDDRSVQEFGDEASVAAMDVAYLAYGQPAVTHVLLRIWPRPGSFEPLSDDQGSSILCHRQKHYSGPVIRDSSACFLHSFERATVVQLVATGGCPSMPVDQKKATR